MRDRNLRAVPTLIIGLAALALLAHAFGRLTRTDWVWWLAPLTVAVEGIRLLRIRDGAFLSPSDESSAADSEAFLQVASCVIATVMAAAGAYAGNRPALLTGTALALVGHAIEWVRTEQSSNLDDGLRTPPF